MSVTSREDVEVVRAVIGGLSLDAAEEDTTAAFVQRLSPDVEFEEDPVFPEAGTYRGRGEVLRYFADFTSQFETFFFKVEDIVDVGDHTVLVAVHIQGRGKGSGAGFDAQSAWVYTVREGQVVRIRAYFDRAEALAAVGLAK